MSTTIPVSFDNWRPTDAARRFERPRFENPVSAQVDSGGRIVGELDAFLQWEGDSLLARVALPDLPGHVIVACCRVTTETDEVDGAEYLWVRAIDVAVVHEPMRPMLGQFAARVDSSLTARN